MEEHSEKRVDEDLEIDSETAENVAGGVGGRWGHGGDKIAPDFLSDRTAGKHEAGKHEAGKHEA